MAHIRNPLAGFALTIAGAAGLSFVAALPLWFLTEANVLPLLQTELIYFYLPFVLFGVGMVSGRSGFLGSLGFIGALLGGFVGIHAYQLFFMRDGWPLWPGEWTFVMTFAFGAACGVGGLAMGKLGLHRITKLTERAPKMRRCARCGAKVGLTARKCWSCRAYLPPT